MISEFIFELSNSNSSMNSISNMNLDIIFNICELFGQIWISTKFNFEYKFRHPFTSLEFSGLLD